jgi:hypothetical protein
MLWALVLPIALAGCDFLHRVEPEPDVVMEPELPPSELPPVQDARPMPPLPRSKPNLAVHHQAAPQAAPQIPVMTDGVPVVMGLNRDGLTRQFGQPLRERDAPPARVLEFGGGECVLAAYLYFDTQRNDFYTLQYEVNGMPDKNPATDACLARIARDAGRR